MRSVMSFCCKAGSVSLLRREKSSDVCVMDDQTETPPSLLDPDKDRKTEKCF